MSESNVIIRHGGSGMKAVVIVVMLFLAGYITWTAYCVAGMVDRMEAVKDRQLKALMEENYQLSFDLTGCRMGGWPHDRGLENAKRRSSQ